MQGTKSAILFALFALGVWLAPSVSLAQYSGVTNPLYVSDANSSTFALADDATACPPGATYSSGRCTIGSYAFEGWEVIELNPFVCDAYVTLTHGANTLPGWGMSYIFTAYSSGAWTYRGSAVVSTATNWTVHVAGPETIRYVLLARGTAFGPVRWYELVATPGLHCF